MKEAAILESMLDEETAEEEQVEDAEDIIDETDIEAVNAVQQQVEGEDEEVTGDDISTSKSFAAKI